jgi:glycosyltransferase involved in cell wall biosynthesis
VSALHIGINALYLIPGGVGGSETYLRNLLRALAALDSPHRFTVFTNRETCPDVAPRHPHWHVRQTGVRARNRPLRLLYEQTLLPLHCAGLDVLFCPGFTAPPVAPCATVTTIHDLQHKRHPEYFRWFERPFWRYFVWQAVHTSARLVAVSEKTRTDLAHFYSIPSDKIAVVWHGVEEEFSAVARLRQGRLAEPVLLCPSTTHPHKNHAQLLKTFRQFSAANPQWQLVMTGVSGFADRAVRAQIAALGLESRVQLLGWLPREELYRWFERAGAVVYPSTFEGFGLPVVEALAAGIPVACSDIEPLRTIAADAAVLFDPASEAGLLQALERVCSDEPLRARLALAGPLRAAQFTWRRCALETLAILERAAGHSRPGL